MNELLILITLGTLVETVVEVVKSIFDDGKVNKVVLLSIFVGLVFAFALQVDIFELLEIAVYIPHIGTIATGLIISRGANFVHDLLDKLSQ